MIFVTQTNAGTMVKHVAQEQMVGNTSYPSRELFSPPSRVCHNVVKRCFKLSFCNFYGGISHSTKNY